MFKRVAIILVVAIALVAMVTAYTNANVANNSTVTVVNSDEALLAMIPGPGADETAFIGANGQLMLDFNRGFDDGTYGIQNYASYAWSRAFYIQNNSEAPAAVDVTVTGVPATFDLDVCAPTGPGPCTTMVNNGVNQANAPYTIQPGERARVNIAFDGLYGLNGNVGQTFNGKITVSATGDN